MPFLGGYAIKFAVSFGAVSAFSAYLMTSLALVDEGWGGLWVCIGSASFIVGYSLSYWLVERKTECANSRLILFEEFDHSPYPLEGMVERGSGEHVFKSREDQRLPYCYAIKAIQKV
jgi:hypothetical protein